MSDTRAPRLATSRLSLAEHKRSIHFVTPEAGTAPDALLDPAYWTHVARLLRPLDRIEAVCEDGTWHQELLVQYAGTIEAKVARLSLTKLDEVDAEAMESDVAEVKFRGPVGKWSVVRKDGQVLKDGMSKADAVEFLAGLKPKAA